MSQSTPTFSLAYTSVRPRFIQKVVWDWINRAKLKELELVICVDQGDTACHDEATKCIQSLNDLPGITGKVVINTGLKTCVAGWNTATAATTGKVIIAVADDFMPPQDWDEKLLQLPPVGWIEGEHVVHVEDGYVHNIVVLPILTRKRYERFGYLFYPKYQSMFCDTELGEVAYRDGVVIDAPHLLFEHLHPDCGKRARDNSDLVHASQERWNAGEMLFGFRKSKGFPVDDGPRAVPEEPARPAEQGLKFAVYMQVIKDDLCLFEVCQRLMEEGCSDFFFAVPDEYWSGEPVPEAESSTLKPVFEKLIEAKARINIKNFHVASYRISPNDSRIVVETRLRNDSLAWVRKAGFEHILIVDGDELWLPGTLAMLKPYVEQGHSAVSVHMIPVLGCPGFPVDSASDVAVVYIGKKCDFRVCRTPTARQTIIEQPRIIHFTSTRRDMDENVKKHLRSGHYGDPDYAFDEWIKNTLPNVKPGMANAHMYRRYQIWPNVRDWRPEEVAIIPYTIRKYLGGAAVAT